ncbi:MAG: chitobiase, partial [Alistipes sp.]|nr:chitobiase [Alistipes sp.]
MKKLYIAACAALLVGATACENNRDANLTEAYVYIVNEGYQVAEFYDLDKEPEASIAIHRSGYFESNATVT